MTAPARGQLPASDFSTLDASKVADTIEVLARRVRERFPDASLVDVCQRLLDVARRVRETTEWIRAPISSIRVITGMLIIVLVVGIISVVAVLGVGFAIYSNQSKKDASSDEEEGGHEDENEGPGDVLLF